MIAAARRPLPHRRARVVLLRIASTGGNASSFVYDTSGNMTRKAENAAAITTTMTYADGTHLTGLGIGAGPAYRARRVRDRFTSTMLERYCRALGIDPFVPSSYGAAGIIVHRQVDAPLACGLLEWTPGW